MDHITDLHIHLANSAEALRDDDFNDGCGTLSGDNRHIRISLDDQYAIKKIEFAMLERNNWDENDINGAVIKCEDEDCEEVILTTIALNADQTGLQSVDCNVTTEEVTIQKDNGYLGLGCLRIYGFPV